jgi:uncharacterized protein
MNPLEIIQKHYSKDSKAYIILSTHARLVADKCLFLAKSKPDLDIDIVFVEEAAMLHDIGICFTNAHDLGCYGSKPYICHGYLGAELLRKEGLPKHAFVCERHTGTGISKADILKNNLPLPHIDMLPISLEEELICFADKFYSKTNLTKEKTVEEVRVSLAKFGTATVEKFDGWCGLFL